jgi:hypothetical protein
VSRPVQTNLTRAMVLTPTVCPEIEDVTEVHIGYPRCLPDVVGAIPGLPAESRSFRGFGSEEARSGSADPELLHPPGLDQ